MSISTIKIEDINQKNAKAVFSAYYNMMQGQLHILEQVEERAQRCLANNATCIKYNEQLDTYEFSACQKCHCSAPQLYFADYKDCSNWGDLQHLRTLEQWLEYKENKKLEKNNQAQNHALHNNQQNTSNGQQRYGSDVSDNSSYERPEEEDDRGIENLLSFNDFSSEE